MIRIRGVRKSFESQLVLDGVDLDIPERSVVSIIGPSGSGKSTLLRTIDFLETANAGTIDFGEGPVSLTSTKAKGYRFGPRENRFCVPELQSVFEQNGFGQCGHRPDPRQGKRQERSRTNRI